MSILRDGIKQILQDNAASFFENDVESHRVQYDELCDVIMIKANSPAYKKAVAADVVMLPYSDDGGHKFYWYTVPSED